MPDPEYIGRSHALHVFTDVADPTPEPTDPAFDGPHYSGRSRAIRIIPESPPWDLQDVVGPIYEGANYRGRSHAIHVRGPITTRTPGPPIPSCKCCAESSSGSAAFTNVIGDVTVADGSGSSATHLSGDGIPEIPVGATNVQLRYTVSFSGTTVNPIDVHVLVSEDFTEIVTRTGVASSFSGSVDLTSLYPAWTAVAGLYQIGDFEVDGTGGVHLTDIQFDGTITWDEASSHASGDCEAVDSNLLGRIVEVGASWLLTYRNGPVDFGDPDMTPVLPTNGYHADENIGGPGETLSAYKAQKSIFVGDYDPFSYVELRTIRSWDLPANVVQARIRGSFTDIVIPGDAALATVGGQVSYQLSVTEWDEGVADPTLLGGWTPSGQVVKAGSVPVPMFDTFYPGDDFDVTVPVNGGSKLQLHLMVTNTFVAAAEIDSGPADDDIDTVTHFFDWTFLKRTMMVADLPFLAEIVFDLFLRRTWAPAPAQAQLSLIDPVVEVVVGTDQILSRSCTPDFSVGLGGLVVDEVDDPDTDEAGYYDVTSDGALLVHVPDPGGLGGVVTAHLATGDTPFIFARMRTPTEDHLALGSAFSISLGFYGDGADPQDSPRVVSFLIQRGSAIKVQADGAGSPTDTSLSNGSIFYIYVQILPDGEISTNIWNASQGPTPGGTVWSSFGGGTPIAVIEGIVVDGELTAGSSDLVGPVAFDVLQATTNSECGGCAGCTDPGSGLPLPDFMPGYMPTFRRQIGDPTTRLDSFICTLESAAMVLAWHTSGAVDVWGGELIPWCGKTEAQIVATGSNLGNAAQAWTHYGQTLSVRSGQTFDDLMNCLAQGRAVILQGDYGVLSNAEKCQDTFDGNHALSLYPYQISDRILAGDPLCHNFGGLRIASLRDYAETFGAAVFGASSPQPILFAVSRAQTPV